MTSAWQALDTEQARSVCVFQLGDQRRQVKRCQSFVLIALDESIVERLALLFADALSSICDFLRFTYRVARR